MNPDSPAPPDLYERDMPIKNLSKCSRATCSQSKLLLSIRWCEAAALEPLWCEAALPGDVMVLDGLALVGFVLSRPPLAVGST
jgi:hypothetical protein